MQRRRLLLLLLIGFILVIAVVWVLPANTPTKDPDYSNTSDPKSVEQQVNTLFSDAEKAALPARETETSAEELEQLRLRNYPAYLRELAARNDPALREPVTREQARAWILANQKEKMLRYLKEHATPEQNP